VRQSGIALTLNCVLHRNNHDTIAEIIELAVALGVRKLELANVQFYGWAYRNRGGLMPTRAQVERGLQVAAQAKRRLAGQLEIVYVLPDYFEDRPKACMHGWGRAFMTVAPNGRAMPCPGAAAIASLDFDNVRDHGLAEIWHESAAFTTYRGTSWMPDPCRSCDRREIDWGGCRCQAFALTGNAGAVDPACALSPDHAVIVALRTTGDRHPTLVPRRMREPAPAP
jgi:pyrroloquinoline quinone biosynthesis protein E